MSGVMLDCGSEVLQENRLRNDGLSRSGIY
jgi:hypothetical protein